MISSGSRSTTGVPPAQPPTRWRRTSIRPKRASRRRRSRCAAARSRQVADDRQPVASASPRPWPRRSASRPRWRAGERRAARRPPRTAGRRPARAAGRAGDGTTGVRPFARASRPRGRAARGRLLVVGRSAACPAPTVPRRGTRSSAGSSCSSVRVVDQVARLARLGRRGSAGCSGWPASRAGSGRRPRRRAPAARRSCAGCWSSAGPTARRASRACGRRSSSHARRRGSRARWLASTVSSPWSWRA